METSYYKFPNRMFLRSEEVIKLVKKLGTMCNSGKPRRALLNIRYPEICPFFDGLSEEDLAAEVNASFTVHQFFNGLDMTSDDLSKFKEQLLAYASDNLVKINAFFDSPYLSKYQTDEVTVLLFPICTGTCLKVMSATTFIANIGGMLGLCMGFSFVSLVEIFFFIVQFIVSKFQSEK